MGAAGQPGARGRGVVEVDGVRLWRPVGPGWGEGGHDTVRVVEGAVGAERVSPEAGNDGGSGSREPWTDVPTRSICPDYIKPFMVEDPVPERT